MEKLNEIIAEYYGFTFVSDRDIYIIGTEKHLYFGLKNVEQSPMDKEYICCRKQNLLFHKSWDWLTPVWHKLITKIWDEGKMDDAFYKELYSQFNTRVARNAPREASELLVEGIKHYKSRQDVIIRKAIKTRLSERKWNVTDLHKATGIRLATLTEFLNKGKGISIDNLEKVMDTLDMVVW